MKSFKETIFFDRSKEENWDIIDKANQEDFSCETSNLPTLDMK